MTNSPRVLFAAAPDAAVEALGLVRQGGSVQAQLAPSADVLQAALHPADEKRWDAVVFVPGGSVEEVEIAAFVPDGLPLFVVANDVPLLLTGTAAVAVSKDALPGMIGRLSATGETSRQVAPEEELSQIEEMPVPSPEPASQDATADASDVQMPESLASLADHLPVGLYRSSPDGRLVYANEALADLLGVASVEELASVDIRRDLGYPRNVFAGDGAATDLPRNLIVSWTRTTGERVHTRENVRAVRDADGGVLYYEGTMEDATAEIDARRDLRDAEASLAVVADHAPHVLYRLRYTPDGPAFDYLSPAIEALTGYDQAEIQARGGLGTLILDRKVFEGDGLAVGPVEGAERYRALYRLRTLDGERWVENAGRPWCDAKGHVLGVAGMLQDVTDRKLHEDRLADAAQAALIRQRALVDLAQLDGEDAFGAPAAAITAATLGATAVSIWTCPDGGVPQPLYTPTALTDVAPARALASALDALATHRTLAIGDTASDPRVESLGLQAFVEAFALRSVLVAPVHHSGRVSGLLVVHRSDQAHEWDATEVEFAAAAADAVALGGEREERARAVDALHESERRHRVLAEMTSDYAFATSERHGRTADLEWTAGASTRLLGEAPSDKVSVDTFRALLTSESRGIVEDLAARWRRDGEAEAEFKICTPDGDQRWVHHHARVGETDIDGSVLVYHSGRDVTLRKRHEAELVEAREAAEAGQAAAERMNRLKSSFLANMSHEIRTPLTGILGFADLLKEEVDPSQVEFVDYISRNGVRLLSTLSAVLDLSRLEAGEYEVNPSVTALAPAVETATAGCVREAAAKGLRFDIELDPAVGALVDATVFHQVVTCVADNAVKFTDSGGVLVAVESAQGPDGSLEAVLRVADTGSGISSSFLPDLFEAFRQEDSGHARSYEGSGLGLTITKRLVDLLGGRIDVASEQPGGTVVTVAFPFVDLPAPAAEAPLPSVGGDSDAIAFPPSESDLLGEPFDFSFLADPAAATAPAASSPEPPADMFSFRFSRPDEDEAPTESPASSTPQKSPHVETSPPVNPAQPVLSQPVHPPRSAKSVASPQPSSAPQAEPPTASAPEPAAPSVAPPSAPEAEPVLIIRAPVSGATIPETSAPEDADVVAETDGRPPVLVVEDNDDTRMLLERILRSTYAVTAVADARSALQEMNRQRFAGLVLDINLGGKETGADVLRIARALPNYEGVFAIALTAYALPGDRERLLEAGFNEYVSKPFTRQSLMDTLAAGVKS